MYAKLTDTTHCPAPKGARPDFSEGFLEDVREARANNTALPVEHEYSTQYRYNSLNQVLAQQSPDGGLSAFWYDKLGRLVVSQNAQQKEDDKYSYTLYDLLGRITEVGQKPHTGAMTQVISQDPEDLEAWISTNANGGGEREQLTITSYDAPYGAGLYPEGILAHEGYLNQRNLRNRVSYSAVKALAGDEDFTAAGFYTYDIAGNVDSLLQNYNGIAVMDDNDQSYKLLAYHYDLVSGKVNGVDYQPGRADAFYHRYQYDAGNRLIATLTSRDSIVWEQDASYQYYRHGPLARTALGQLQVQGMDYAYTLQGWLKGVNSTALGDGSHDIGKDGLPAARDLLGFALHYYDDGEDQQDYKPIGGTNGFARPNNGAFSSLYNGNIRAMSINNAGLAKAVSDINPLPLFYKYGYDQLNRLVSMRAYKGFDNGTNEWTPVLLDDYKEDVSYDPNGNILSYERNGAPEAGGQELMDELVYTYYTDKNQLKRVTDAVSAGNYATDIDNQSETENYVYDKIGNLVADKAEGITDIEWNVYGKIQSIVKTSGTVNYTYDAAGNRISKEFDGKTTVYVRDAAGNVMSVYEKTGAGALEQAETHLYGSSRIGILTRQTTAPTTGINLDELDKPAVLYTFTRGEKIFELSNHLGNVLATVSDRKLGHDGGEDEIDYYEADVVSAQDYYPFGQLEPGRQYGALGRYGFNGKEKDNEIKGEGAQYDYGFRIYDPRLGRFLSVDPLFKSYPWYTPYQFAGNMPIWAIDLDGLEEMKANSVANVIKDLKGNIITTPTVINDPERTVDIVPGVKRLNDQEIEVTPGLIEKPHPFWNTFTYQQVNGKVFMILQSNTPIGQDAGGTPPKTNLQQDNDDVPPPAGRIPTITPIDDRKVKDQTLTKNINFVSGEPQFASSADKQMVKEVADRSRSKTTPGKPKTETTGNTTTTTTTTRQVRSIITIDLRTNRADKDLQTNRYNLLRQQLIDNGIPARNIRRGKTEYSQSDESMGGRSNQTIFRIKTTTSTRTTGTTTTTTP